jgi:fatty-acyl-CoA synthase
MGSEAGSTIAPLTPTAFLERSSIVFADKVAVIDGDQRFTYGEFADRSRRLASAIREAGVAAGDRVAALCVNSHVMLEMHNGVPGSGAVLVPLNIRLAAGELAEILGHCGASLLVADDECAELAREVSASVGVRLVVAGPGSEYEQLIAGAVAMPFSSVEETDLLAINYTSGSTGRPKGVMYNHRGAYLQSLAMAFHLNLNVDSAYLWTLPMFHCDGWCHTWAVTAAGAVHICVRRIDPPKVWSTISSGTVSHLAAAPTVLNMIAAAATNSADPPPSRSVLAATGGAPPTPAMLDRLAPLNISVVHLYGLTETYGPSVINQKRQAWSDEPREVQLALNARQGIGNVVTGGVRVVDVEGNEVPSDGQSVGEITIMGNNVMVGYYRDEEATAAALRGGWLHTGDLAVRHPDGYIEMHDRAKDIVITGGENVSSLEIERLICEHPSVLEAAVVALPDDRWGEVPVAVVTLRAGTSSSEIEIIEFVRSRAAHFKAPKVVYFAELPKTGKVQKNLLRDWVRSEAHHA